jgi:hypothetical protein
MQVYRDGHQWEQSPLYHNHALIVFLDIVMLCIRNGIDIPKSLFETIHKMALATMGAIKPDHTELAGGDSDAVDVRDVLTKAAVLFKDPCLRYTAYGKPDYDSAWELGEAGIAEYATLKPTQPGYLDKYDGDSGHAVFRTSWDESATFLHFSNGTLGAGHGHADKLHVDLFARGEDILVDPGRFSYVFDENRIAFKRQAAHNTTVVDGKELYTPIDSWESKDLARAVNTRFYCDERYGYAEGGHVGYCGDGVFVNRRVVFIKPDIIVLADEFYTGGDHEYEQYFHFGDAGKIVGGDEGYVYESANVRADVIFGANSLRSEVFDYKISRRYNHAEDALGIRTSFGGSGFCAAYTFIAISGAEKREKLNIEKLAVKSNFKGITFDDATIEAFNISFGKSKYTFVVSHKEFACPTDTFLADGCSGFGGVVLFDRAAGETEIGTVLVW